MSKKSERIYTKRGRPITEPLTVLTRARDLLASGGTWCRGPLARGTKAAGRPDRFCAVGALDEAANVRFEWNGNGTYTTFDDPDAVWHARTVLGQASREMHGMGPAEFSDRHAKNVGEVVKVYDRAIEMEKANRKARKALVSA